MALKLTKAREEAVFRDVCMLLTRLAGEYQNAGDGDGKFLEVRRSDLKEAARLAEVLIDLEVV